MLLTASEILRKFSSSLTISAQKLESRTNLRTPSKLSEECRENRILFNLLVAPIVPSRTLSLAQLKDLTGAPFLLNEYFFWTGTSKPKSAVGDWQRALNKLFRLADIRDGHSHRFRHTFAKTLLMAGLPVERVSVLLGHRSPAITLKYYSAWVRERQQQLEADVQRVWNEKGRPKNTEKTLKQTESAIQPLYGNRSEWIN